MDLKQLKWSPAMLAFFDNLNPSILPRIVSSSEIYGHVSSGSLKSVPIAGIVGDQQAALVGNKCFKQGEAKNTYGTGAFLLFNTGTDVVKSENGLLSTVAYQAGPDAKPYFALEGSSEYMRSPKMMTMKSASVEAN
jgi:glycerol kinase